MSKKGDPKMKAYAAWMKEHGIKRTTAQCPIDHRHTYRIGDSGHFLGHH